MTSVAPSAPQQTHFQSASIYAGDLDPSVGEQLLYETFNRVGPVASVRVCRDSVTRRSLGYAYINFHQVTDAERSLDTMNFAAINGRPCRLMWSQRDPTLRKSGVGNVFLKNLPANMDDKDVYDVFSVFGNILSVKVAKDETGKSKGYAYVHFETAVAANAAMEKMNGASLEGNPITVSPYVKSAERKPTNAWTNLYVKQFPESWDEEKLRELFTPFGEVANIYMTRDETGKSKMTGFVNFTEHDSAERALNELNEKDIGEAKPLYVSRAQTKKERVEVIKAYRDKMLRERSSRFQGMNLYVKNIDDTITDEQFKEIFAPHGTITSARIMRTDAGVSRGFGFVCYSSPEEATKAVSEQNGKPSKGGSKPLYVTLHQQGAVRKAHLAALRNGGVGIGIRSPPYGQQPYMPMPYMNMGGRGFQRGGVPMAAYPRGMMYAPGMPMAYGGMPMQQNAPMGNRGAHRGPPMMMGPNGPMPGQPYPQPRGGRGAGGNPRQQGQPQAGRGVKVNPNARNMPAAAPVQNANGALDLANLSNLTPQDQKNAIGERLYPMIHAQEPTLAGKITGMLLEMDNAELLHLLESPDALLSKIQEALQVLHAHEPA
jgi:polyadenylate-binding protein